MATIDRLIFIYNADGGIAQGVLDTLHKTLSPTTYPCSLCAITHGVLRINPKWRYWLKQLDVPVFFQHKDDTPYRDVALPVVLAERNGEAHALLDAAQLNALGNVDALIAALEARLS